MRQGKVSEQTLNFFLNSKDEDLWKTNRNLPWANTNARSQGDMSYAFLGEVKASLSKLLFEGNNLNQHWEKRKEFFLFKQRWNSSLCISQYSSLGCKLQLHFLPGIVKGTWATATSTQWGDSAFCLVFANLSVFWFTCKMLWSFYMKRKQFQSWSRTGFNPFFFFVFKQVSYFQNYLKK